MSFRVAEFKFDFKFRSLPVIWPSLPKLFQKVIKGFDFKINCQAQWAVKGKHKHKKSAAFAVSANRFILGRGAATCDTVSLLT